MKPTMRTSEVKTATDSEREIVIDALKLAFGSDPAIRWVWPDPQKYLLHFSEFAKAFGGRAFVNNTAFYVGNYSGAALWLPPNIEPDIDTMLGLLHSTTSEDVQNILPSVFEKMGSFHPNEPHWYLPLLGVDPLYHGKDLVLYSWNIRLISLITIVHWHIWNHQTKETFLFINAMDLNYWGPLK